MKLRLNLTERDDCKKLFYKLLFLSKYGLSDLLLKIEKLFKKEFPTVYFIFKQINNVNKKDLARLLQRIESYLVLDVICKQFSEQYCFSSKCFVSLYLIKPVTMN